MPKLGKRKYGSMAGVAHGAATLLQGAWRRYSAGRRGRGGLFTPPGLHSSIRTATDSRGPGSSSRTMQQRRIPQGRVMNEGTGGQVSYFHGPHFKSSLPPWQVNAVAPQVVQSNLALQSKSAVGRQTGFASPPICDSAAASAFVNDKFSRVIIEKATSDVTMNNIYLSNCYIMIYDIIARKDVGNTSISNPYSTWAQGTTDESQPNAANYLGSTPFDNELFNQYYKVCQVTSVVLGAGATHVHKVRMQPNRLVSGAYLEYTPYCLKDITYFTLVEFHGSPANDSTTQTQVGIGVGGLNVIFDQETTYKQVAKYTPTISTTNNLLSAFTVGEQVVNLGGSTIVAQAEG